MNSPTSASARPTAAAIAHAFLATPSGQRCQAMLGDARARTLPRMVRALAIANRLALDPNRRHFTRDLCGASAWAQLRPREKVCAGMCMAFLVARKLLPLRTHVTRSGKGARSYWLLPDQPWPIEFTDADEAAGY